MTDTGVAAATVAIGVVGRAVSARGSFILGSGKGGGGDRESGGGAAGAMKSPRLIPNPSPGGDGRTRASGIDCDAGALSPCKVASFAPTGGSMNLSNLFLLIVSISGAYAPFW